MKINNPKLYILSSVAGGGKSTLISMLLKNHPELEFSVSHTTRAPRPGDVPGKTYHFKTIEEFRKGIDEGEYLEWAQVHGNYYGTPKSFILRCFEFGVHVILDIDVQGAKIVKEKMPLAKTIFILPPSEDIWITRLTGRNTDSPESIARRIANGKKELLEKDWFDHRIINDELNEAYLSLEKIIYP